MSDLLLVNAHSRRTNARKTAAIAARIAAAGRRAEVRETRSVDEAQTIVREAVAEGLERLWVAGGDGAVNSVVPILAGSDTALAVIPLGTGNVLARELRIPIRWQRAVDALICGETRVTDLGEANGRLFVLFIGFGFDAEVARRVGGRLKAWIGRTEFFRAAVCASLTYSPFEIEIATDETVIRHRAWMALLTNTPTYAGVLNLAPQADPTDGILDIWVATAEPPGPRSRPAFIAQGLDRLLLKRPMPGECLYRCRSARVTCRPEVWMQADGEPFGRGEVEVRVRPSALRLVVPRTVR